jgi:hypothetical protein
MSNESKLVESYFHRFVYIFFCNLKFLYFPQIIRRFYSRFGALALAQPTIKTQTRLKFTFILTSLLHDIRDRSNINFADYRGTHTTLHYQGIECGETSFTSSPRINCTGTRDNLAYLGTLLLPLPGLIKYSRIYTHGLIQGSQPIILSIFRFIIQ